MKLILRDEAIKADLEKPWLENLMGFYLKNLFIWIQRGYVFTNEQIEMVERIMKDAGR